MSPTLRNQLKRLLAHAEALEERFTTLEIEIVLGGMMSGEQTDRLGEKQGAVLAELREVAGMEGKVREEMKREYENAVKAGPWC